MVLVHVSGWQHPPPAHTAEPAQSPQSILSPHPSFTFPQVAPSEAQVFGTQQVISSVHVSLAPHPPQSNVPPQPSSSEPHSAFSLLHVLQGWQVLSSP